MRGYLSKYPQVFRWFRNWAKYKMLTNESSSSLSGTCTNEILTCLRFRNRRCKVGSHINKDTIKRPLFFSFSPFFPPEIGATKVVFVTTAIRAQQASSTFLLVLCGPVAPLSHFPGLYKYYGKAQQRGPILFQLQQRSVVVTSDSNKRSRCQRFTPALCPGL